MENFKIEAKTRLLNRFIDKRGRVQESPRYPTGNPHLYTGEAAILLYMNGLLTDVDMLRFSKGYAACRAVPGLFSRHPDPWRFSEHYDVVSHDEYNGLIFSSAATLSIGKPQYEVATEICDYGSKNYFQFLDKYPGANFFNKFFKNPIKAFKTVKKMFKVDEKGREAFDPDYQALPYQRQPRDIAFYKMISPRYKAGFFSLLYFCLANIISTYKKKEYARGTSKILAIFRHEALRISGNDNFLTKLTRKIIYRKLRKLHGDEFLHYYMVLHFNAEPDHPFHDLSKGIKLR